MSTQSEQTDQLPNLEERPWEAFANASMFWFINRIIHVFGWALVAERDEDGRITRVFPASCRFRGFSAESEAAGFKRLTRHLNDNIDTLMRDTQGEETG